MNNTHASQRRGPVFWVLLLLAAFLLANVGVTAPGASVTPVQTASDVQSTHISDIRLLGALANVTVKGYFINKTGTRVGDSFSGTALVGNGVNAPRSFATIAGVALPTGASAAIVSLSGPVYMDRAPAPASGTDDFLTNYTRFDYIVPRAGPTPFGRATLDETSGTSPEGPVVGAGAITNPSVASSTSVTLLAANPSRRYVFIQNNTSVTIAISLTGIVMTGIAPTAAKPCIVLLSGQGYSSEGKEDVTQAITCYQTSGATTEAVTVRSS